MNQKLILENWRKFLKEEQTLTTTQPSVSATENVIDDSQKKEEAKIVSVTAAINSSIETALKSQEEVIKTIPNKQAVKDAIKNLIDKIQLREAKKKKKQRCCFSVFHKMQCLQMDYTNLFTILIKVEIK